MAMYGLKLADGSEAVVNGENWRSAAKDYVGKHGGAVVAYKQLPEPHPIHAIDPRDPRTIENTVRSHSFGGKRWR